MRTPYRLTIAWHQRRYAAMMAHCFVTVAFIFVTVVVAKVAQYTVVGSYGRSWSFPAASFAGLIPVVAIAFLVDRFVLRVREAYLV